jgi:hypothetical protein
MGADRPDSCQSLWMLRHLEATKVTWFGLCGLLPRRLPANTARAPMPIRSCWSWTTEHVSLYEAFEPTEARRLADKLEIHYMPKHASWLNTAESELSVLSRQCLDRRIPDRRTLFPRQRRGRVIETSSTPPSTGASPLPMRVSNSSSSTRRSCHVDP